MEFKGLGFGGNHVEFHTSSSIDINDCAYTVHRYTNYILSLSTTQISLVYPEYV